MNTIKDFKNAPVGATATHRTTGARAMKMDEVERRWITPNGFYLDDEDMANERFTLEPLEPAPTTAREALDLAWELAHPVKEGQVIPEGTQYLELFNSKLRQYTARYLDGKLSSELASITRTLEPLPDPEPDWLDAPAVLASHPLCADTEQIGIWIPSKKDGMWEWPIQQGQFSAHWSELRDVTPLYPPERRTGHMSNQHCLQCGESRTAVKNEGLYCVTVGYGGEFVDEWDRHRWRDWTDQELASLGILPEYYDKYRRTEVYDLNFIGCRDRGREHIPLKVLEQVCCACWHDVSTGVLCVLA